jgi:hypothetical protein
MSAATPTVDAVGTELSLTERRALRTARIRGVVLAALGLFALQLATGMMDVSATFSFWIQEQGGDAFVIATTVGVLWIIAGVVTGASGLAQLVRGTRPSAGARRSS